MKSISSVHIVLNLIKKVKLNKKGFLTNLFLDIPKMKIWIDLKLIEYEEINETIFIFRKNQDFYNLFFISTNINALSEGIDLLKKKLLNDIYVVDIIGHLNDVSELKTFFLGKGYYQYTSLVRMSKLGYSYYPDDGIFQYLSYADKLKALTVYHLLLKYFDPYAEQLPFPEEVIEWANNNRVIIYCDEYQSILGFLIFELLGQTSYLRYWFVDPDHRGKKIGSTLLRKYFADSFETKRQIFWVIESNENAILRYEHYGYRKEELFDNIMINKNICYEG
jgi:ribosomal protein S18 acetylase RimI-like enzyme